MAQTARRSGTRGNSRTGPVARVAAAYPTSSDPPIILTNETVAGEIPSGPRA